VPPYPRVLLVRVRKSEKSETALLKRKELADHS
jgi:hypothetical protein